jgi:intracellular septation protein A
MKNLIHSGRLLLLDMASTVFFLVLYSVTGSLALSVALGMALGVAQIGWEIARHKPIDTMQWVSLVVVVASGTAALVTHDARFMMLKLTVIYAIIGVVMLKPGWLDRYMPPQAMELVPDVAVVFGFVWAGLMFFSAVLNLVVAFSVGVAAWASIMSAWGLASKLSLFVVQYTTMRLIGGRRYRARAALTVPPAVELA